LSRMLLLCPWWIIRTSGSCLLMGWSWSMICTSGWCWVMGRSNWWWFFRWFAINWWSVPKNTTQNSKKSYNITCFLKDKCNIARRLTTRCLSILNQI